MKSYFSALLLVCGLILMGAPRQAAAQSRSKAAPVRALIPWFTMQNKVIVVQNGASIKPLTTDVTLPNGTRIDRRTQTVIMANGTRVAMREGDMLSLNGEFLQPMPTATAAPTTNQIALAQPPEATPPPAPEATPATQTAPAIETTSSAAAPAPAPTPPVAPDAVTGTPTPVGIQP